MVANSVAIAPGLSRPLLGALEKSFYLGIAPSAFADQKVLACLSQSDSNSSGSRPNLMHFAQNIVDWLVNNVYRIAMPRTSTAKERLTDAALGMIWGNSYGATSVDAICEQAGVKKGSFYYFFKSKSDLAAAALDADWKKHQAQLDSIFSPTVPPFERLERYFEFNYERLVAIKKECGAVLGCPLYTLGSEVCTQDMVLRGKIQEILDRKMTYLESAIRDAHAQGLIAAPDAKAKAQALFMFIQGALTQARIQNNVDVLRDVYPGALDLLGAGKVGSPA
jgi:TetR/AcrR family transcriptional regulator, transcriptional repressor for nem operon